MGSVVKEMTMKFRNYFNLMKMIRHLAFILLFLNWVIPRVALHQELKAPRALAKNQPALILQSLSADTIQKQNESESPLSSNVQVFSVQTAYATQASSVLVCGGF